MRRRLATTGGRIALLFRFSFAGFFWGNWQRKTNRLLKKAFQGFSNVAGPWFKERVEMSESAEQLISSCNFGEGRFLVSAGRRPQVALLVRERSEMIRYLGKTTVASRAGLFEEQGCIVVVVLLQAGEHVRPIYPVWWDYHAAAGAESLRLMAHQPVLGVHFHGNNGRRDRSFVLENPLREFFGKALQRLADAPPWTGDDFRRSRQQLLARFGSLEALWHELGEADWFERIELRWEDITRLEVDAIVNAANSSLSGGAGVDGAIHWAAGSGLDEECRQLGGCPKGEARITGGHLLPARYVIHTVGPVYGLDPEPEKLLASCYRSCLQLAAERGLRTIAFPAISCGAYRFPVEKACPIAIRTIIRFLAENRTVEKVCLVVYSADHYRVYHENIHRIQERSG
jgi:O-acetyl-ADP-ribose deacetylase (regulator of RNase III)